MSDIDLTKTELIMILDCIGNRIEDLQDCASYGDAHLVADEIQALSDLEDRIGCRVAFGEDQRNERFTTAIPDTAAQLVDAGIVAREMLKEERRNAFADSDIRTGSLAAQRRQEELLNEACAARMMLGTATPFIEEE